MKMRLVLVLFVVAIAIVALTPSKASAGWGWWGGPGVNIYVGPRYPYYGYYGYGYRPYPQRLLRLSPVWLLRLPSLWLVWPSIPILAAQSLSQVALSDYCGRCAASFLWSLQVSLVQVGRSSRHGAGTRSPGSRP